MSSQSQLVLVVSSNHQQSEAGTSDIHAACQDSRARSSQTLTDSATVVSRCLSSHLICDLADIAGNYYEAYRRKSKVQLGQAVTVLAAIGHNRLLARPVSNARSAVILDSNTGRVTQ